MDKVARDRVEENAHYIWDLYLGNEVPGENEYKCFLTALKILSHISYEPRPISAIATLAELSPHTISEYVGAFERGGLPVYRESSDSFSLSGRPITLVSKDRDAEPIDFSDSN